MILARLAFAALAIIPVAAHAEIRPCKNPWSAYKTGAGAPFRPMLQIMPQSRATGSDRNSTLQLSLKMEREPKPLLIGDDAVQNLPVFRARPVAGSASGVFLDLENKSRCEVDKADLSDPRFEETFAYSGSVWALLQGDTLKVDVSSALDYQPNQTADWQLKGAPFGSGSCNWANLHTHGLLVPPFKKGSKLGDYIYDAASKNGGAGTVDVCSGKGIHGHGEVADTLHHEITLPGHPSDNQRDALLTGHHPSGLFWYHPHIHGYSAQELAGGTTGLMTVGEVADYAKPGVVPARAHERFMMLKDVQIVDLKRSASLNGQQHPLWDYHAETFPDLCSFGPNDDYSFWEKGECTQDANDTDPSHKDRVGVKWVFTVNGTKQPHIEEDLRPGEAEIWRIANASPSASYHLSIIPSRQIKNHPGGNFDRLAFTVISKDGAGIDSTGRTPQDAEEKEILLMPGARVEILIKQVPTEEYALVTEGVKTGGDAWPRMVLATIKGPELRGIRRMVENRRMAKPLLELRGPSINAFPTPLLDPRSLLSYANDKQPACGRIDGYERVIFFVKNPNQADPDLFGLVTGLRRRGRVDAGEMKYYSWKQMPQAANGKAIDLRTITPDDADFRTMKAEAFTKDIGKNEQYPPAFGSTPSYSNVCIPHGEHYAERWVIENWTNETHNFHLHQTRFLIDQGKLFKYRFLGRRQLHTEYFNFPCQSASYLKNDTECAADDPQNLKDWNDKKCSGDHPDNPDCYATGYSDELIQNFFTSHSSLGLGSALLGASFHDSVPIPRGTGDCNGTIVSRSSPSDGDPKCNPGRVTLIVPLNRREQIGSFVYHCHILEHEDRGMMATIQIYDPNEPVPVAGGEGLHSGHHHH